MTVDKYKLAVLWRHPDAALFAFSLFPEVSRRQDVFRVQVAYGVYPPRDTPEEAWRAAWRDICEREGGRYTELNPPIRVDVLGLALHQVLERYPKARAVGGTDGLWWIETSPTSNTVIGAHPCNKPFAAWVHAADHLRSGLVVKRDVWLDKATKEVKMNQDPWKHRAENMRCKTCMWFAPKQGDIGRCRRHAPTMNGYPVVMVTDWCGDHKLNEVK